MPTTTVPAEQDSPSHPGARAGSPAEKPPRSHAKNRLLQLLRDLRCSVDRCRARVPAWSSPGHVGRGGCGGRTDCPFPSIALTPGRETLGGSKAGVHPKWALGCWEGGSAAAVQLGHPSPAAGEVGDPPLEALGRVTP